MAALKFGATGASGRSILLAQGPAVPWSQLGVTDNTARGLGLTSPRGTLPNAAPEAVPWYGKLVRRAAIGLQIAEWLQAIAGPPPIRWSEIALGDGGDLSVRIYGTSYAGPEAGSAEFRHGIGGPSLGVTATVTEDGLIFDPAALERAYGKALPAVLAAASANTAVPWEDLNAGRRESSADARLSAIKGKARALLAAIVAQLKFKTWVAHHLIPFDCIERLPMLSRLAIARSGWVMDSLENLVMLPGDEETYESAPNFRVFPYHRGSHSNYNTEVTNRLGHLAWAAPTMDSHDIRVELDEIEETMFERLLDRKNGYHRRVTENARPRPSAFG